MSSITPCLSCQRAVRQIARAFALFVFMLVSTCVSATQQKAPVAIAIHGGAGTLNAADFTDALKTSYLSKMTEALRAGHEILLAGGSSLPT